MVFAKDAVAAEQSDGDKLFPRKWFQFNRELFQRPATLVCTIPITESALYHRHRLPDLIQTIRTQKLKDIQNVEYMFLKDDRHVKSLLGRVLALYREKVVQEESDDVNRITLIQECHENIDKPNETVDDMYRLFQELDQRIDKLEKSAQLEKEISLELSNSTITEFVKRMECFQSCHSCTELEEEDEILESIGTWNNKCRNKKELIEIVHNYRRQLVKTLQTLQREVCGKELAQSKYNILKEWIRNNEKLMSLKGLAVLTPSLNNYTDVRNTRSRIKYLKAEIKQWTREKLNNLKQTNKSSCKIDKMIEKEARVNCNLRTNFINLIENNSITPLPCVPEEGEINKWSGDMEEMNRKLGNPSFEVSSLRVNVNKLTSNDKVESYKMDGMDSFTNRQQNIIRLSDIMKQQLKRVEKLEPFYNYRVDMVEQIKTLQNTLLIENSCLLKYVGEHKVYLEKLKDSLKEKKKMIQHLKKELKKRDQIIKPMKKVNEELHHDLLKSNTSRTILQAHISVLERELQIAKAQKQNRI